MCRHICLTPLPGSLLPVTVFDKHSLRVLFTFARDCPPSRPDVLVVIISMLSSAPTPVTNIRFQAAVPKVPLPFHYVLTELVNTAPPPSSSSSPLQSNFLLVQVMKVKLQPPSTTELPAFNPILPPAAVTQILLLANPHKVLCHMTLLALAECQGNVFFCDPVLLFLPRTGESSFAVQVDIQPGGQSSR